MRRILITILISLLFLFISPTIVHGEKIAGNSALIAYSNRDSTMDSNIFIKKLAIKRILEKYNSPLLASTDSFIQTCIQYNIDCYLLPSITGLESTFGKFILPNSNNPFGWGGGYIMFKSWEEGIDTVGKGLRTNYIDKGASDIYQIGKIYSESDTWAQRVNILTQYFQKEEEKLQLLLNEKKVQL